jgi:hypothetical protein
MRSGPWKTPERISNAGLRLVFEESGAQVADVCRALGWMRGDGRGVDSTKLRRVLGIAAPGPVTVAIESARAVCDVIGVNFDTLDRTHPARCACGEVCGPGENRCGFCVIERVAA